MNIYVKHPEDVKVELMAYGRKLAEENPQKNDRWDIEWCLPVPVVPRVGELSAEIVIGNRHTDFQPYVAWYRFGGKNYAYGDYCQTFDGAFNCAIQKMCRELGIEIDD